MLSIAAYDLLSIILCGEVTVHTLYLGVLDRVKSNKAADEILLNAMIELCEQKMLFCQLELDYNRASPVREVIFSGPEFYEAWRACFGNEGPRTEYPSPSTISVDASNFAHEGLEDSKYDCYRDLLINWYGYDEEAF